MKKSIVIVIFLLSFVYIAFATPAIDSPLRKVSTCTGTTGFCVDADNGTISMGDPISSAGVEYPVWEKLDSNDDVVASMVVVCSDITDGQQVCQIKFYVMSDTPGTLTNELTIDVNTD